MKKKKVFVTLQKIAAVKKIVTGAVITSFVIMQSLIYIYDSSRTKKSIIRDLLSADVFLALQLKNE